MYLIIKLHDFASLLQKSKASQIKTKINPLLQPARTISPKRSCFHHWSFTAFSQPQKPFSSHPLNPILPIIQSPVQVLPAVNYMSFLSLFCLSWMRALKSPALLFNSNVVLDKSQTMWALVSKPVNGTRDSCSRGQARNNASVYGLSSQ